MRKHITTIRGILRESGYLKIALVSAFLFFILNLWLLTRTTTLPSVFRMAWAGDYFGNFAMPTARILSVAYESLYILLTLASVAAFGAASALIVWLFRHSRGGKVREMKLGIGGTLAALFSSGCPVCGTFLLSLIGVAGGIGILPLKGLELKTLALGLMVGSVGFAARRVAHFKKQGCASGVCEACPATVSLDKSSALSSPTKLSFDGVSRGIVWAITILLATNQFMIGSMVPKTAKASPLSGLRTLFSSQGTAAREIIATKINPDGHTTSVVKQPTITEVSAEPKGGDPVEAAKVVMIATGTPFYAPSGISFDDPVGALAAWQPFEDQIQLGGDLQARWEKIVSTMTCDYCCGGPTRVTAINRCGCRHAQAYRSIAKHLLQTVGDKYTDDEILGELQRWKGIWYPKGVIEDYLLATGRVDALGHQTHGGAGADGMHGIQ